MYRNTYINIDCNIIKNNIKNIIANYKYDYYIGVVKGNCYGHGIDTIKYMIASGINYLAVSNLYEAIKVREKYKNISILCLEPIDLKYIDEIIKNNITITINDINYFNEIKKIELEKKIRVHIKINSGMNRLGFNNKNEVKEVCESNILEVEGIYTHFATRGYTDKYYDIQLSNFKDIISLIDLNNIKIVHGYRSLTLVTHDKNEIFNGCRLGIMMYGLNPLVKLPNTFKNKIRKLKYSYLIKKNNISKTNTESNLKINTSLSLYTEVIQINKIKKGDFVEYGASFVANKDLTVATLDIGYADGFKRSNIGGDVFINNKRYKIIGDIGMGMISVLVDDNVKLHDKVELIGKNINIREVSNRCNTTAYEIYTTLSENLKRNYYDKN